MTAIATVLAAMGHQVSGSDLKPSDSVLERLRGRRRRRSRVGHDAANVGDAELVAISTAIPPDNPEVVGRGARGIPVLRRAELLAAIVRDPPRRSRSPARTARPRRRRCWPSCSARPASTRRSSSAATSNEIGGGAVWDDGDLFVVEADESDGTFLALPRAAAIVTNVEPDHLEHYGGFAPLLDAVRPFRGRDAGPGRDLRRRPARRRAARRAPTAVTYGTRPDADYRMVDLRGGAPTARSWSPRPRRRRPTRRSALPVAGQHNARNATAAAVMAHRARRGPAARGRGRSAASPAWPAASSPGRGGGRDLRRRLRPPADRGARRARGGRQGGMAPGRVRVPAAPLQPHRGALARRSPTRSAAPTCWCVTDIYPAGEAPRPGHRGKLVLRPCSTRIPRRAWPTCPTLDDLVAYRAAELRPGDLCLTLGAGDLTSHARPAGAAAASDARVR